MSVAASRLQPALEGAQQGFVAGSCRRHRVCDDITAGLIPYAIRNATVSAGEARTEEQAQRYWGLVADQIAAACSDGRLSCGRPMPTMLPSPSRISVTALVASAWSSFRWMATYRPADTARPPSTGSARNWALFQRTVNGLPATLQEHQQQERVGLARARYLAVLRLAYQAAVLLLLPLALAGYVLAPVRRPPRWSAVWVLGVAAGVAVLGRVLLLALIDSTSFLTAQASNYALPAMSFLLVFTALGVVLLLRCWPGASGLVRPRRPPWTWPRSLGA